MRDPARIDKFCNDLAALWKMVPDWRFGQFISNVLGEYVAEIKQDIFFPEDEDVMKFMKKYFKQENSSPWGKTKEKENKELLLNNYMSEKLAPHIGHNVAVVAYGNVDNPCDICVECEDCNEVLVSAEDYEEM